MKVRILIIILIAMMLQNCAPHGKLDKLTAPGAKPELLSGDFLFTEGPAPDQHGNVYFTDQPNNRIMVWSVDDQLSLFMQPCGRSNGLYFDREGNLWSCADEKNELWQIDPGKNIRVVVSQHHSAALNGPNDLWIAPNGSVYFTDPYYQRSWWSHSEMPQDRQGVYLFEPASQSLIRVADDLVKPNGIIGTPDGKTLYVADIGAGKTWRYTIDNRSRLSDKTLFCELGSDGMTLDEKGNLYLTGKGVTIFDRQGNLLGNIPIPESWTANVCFGGADRKSLFITASKGLYRVKMRVRGV